MSVALISALIFVMKSSVFTKRSSECSVKGFKIRARYLESLYVADKQNDSISFIGVSSLWVLGNPCSIELQSCEYKGFLTMLATCQDQSFSISLRCILFGGSHCTYSYHSLNNIQVFIFGTQIYPSLRTYPPAV